MRILVANDDGIYSPGIFALAQAAEDFGEVRIVAPDVEQSSMGHAVTASRPLTHKKTPIHHFDAWRVNGTPADCVSLGVSIWGKVDLVLSGINLGLNIGNGCWHSGTLAAAKQAALLGLRGIALSTPMENEEPDFDALKPSVREVLEQVIAYDFPLLNVNLPPRPQGVRWTRQSVRHYNGSITPGTDPRGRQHYWFHEVPVEETEEDTDRWAVQNGLTSIMPVRLDLTDHEELARALQR
ncbi:5'/3'-nucleotidase SurE [Gilvimarinus sp. F26214L]|uniref:5'/3'-nucleotidase SurE n=1 Tax=Gilvimarinus sp. DZF01 TaxID=3461371 RepID=UPI00404683E7